MVHATTPYGLLGRTLGHSFSPQIHTLLGSAPYALYELEPDEFDTFVQQEPWVGLNVTIPYKLDALRLADAASDQARAAGAANTLVRRLDGTIYADNTDVSGFATMLAHFCQRQLGTSATDLLGGQEVLVLGTGGASRAVVVALEELGAVAARISRTGNDTYATLASKHPHARLIVNTTPVGMYPNVGASPLTDEQLASLGELQGVLDIIYNPARTTLCQLAEAQGLPYATGLEMLVAQAQRSSELFTGTSADNPSELIGSISATLAHKTQNVALIGMPGSGKTTCGRRLARALKRPFVDIDDALTTTLGMKPAEFLQRYGEEAFRDAETSELANYSKESGLVIACGGGVVVRPENYQLLHHNSHIVMLDRPLDELSSEGRPLSAAHGVEALAAQRMEHYRSWADTILACTGSAAGDADAIIEQLGLPQ